MKWKNLDRRSSRSIEDLKNKSPYEILRVAPSASVEEIRQSYRSLIKAYHPDKSDRFMRRGNEDVAKLINNAYDLILRERNEQR